MKKLLLLLGVFLLSTSFMFAQKTITGKVTSKSDGSSLPGVAVLVKGKTTGTITDADGNYKLTVPEATTTLVFSFVGMTKQEVEIGTQTSINVVMETASTVLEGIVVTALGISKQEKALGYSVQQVSGDVISQSDNTNVVNSLGGKVAGVQVTNSSGAAGSSSYITIRGSHSVLGENQPLFIVDGVPIDNSQSSSNGSLVDGVALSNRAIDINPDDIAAISVLKGGAATALYGLRAANGVVMISTKKGKTTGANKINVTYNSSVSFDKVNKLPEVQTKFGQGDGGQWLGPETKCSTSWGPKLDTCAYSNGPLAANQDPYNFGYYDWDKNGLIVGKNDPTSNGKAVTPYDNLKNFFQTGVSYNNDLSLSGGNESSTYYFSMSNSTSKGIIPLNTFDKTTVKIAGDTKLSKKISTSGSVNYINSGGYRIQQGSNMSGLMLGLLRTPVTFDNANGYSDPANTPDAYTFIKDGYVSQPRTYRGFGKYDNPYWTVNENPYRDDVNRIIGNFAVVYNPLEWLNFTYRLGNDWYTDKRKGDFAIGSAAFPTGQIMLDNQYNMDINSDFICNISRNITNDIKSNLTLGQNMYQTKFHQTYVQGDQLALPDFYNISNALTVQSKEFIDQKRTAAFYGDLGLDYKSMVFLDVTGREEWTTTLSKPFFFPSASLGFVFTELPSLVKNSVLSFGKVRASYANVANDAPTLQSLNYYSSAAFLDGWTTGISFPFEGQTGYMIDPTLGNAGLKPEEMRSLEFGTELKFFKNRLGIDFTYYNNKNQNVILDVPVAGSSGYAAKLMNAATMVNKGIEAMLDVTPVKTKDWEWNMLFNFTKNNNMVVALAPGVDNVYIGGFTGSEIRAVVGQPYGEIYGTDWVKDGSGNIVINDDPTSSSYRQPMMSETEVSLGNTQAKWLLGITNTLKYKNVSLSFLVDIKAGGVMWNGTKGALDYFGTAKNTETRGDSIIMTGVQGHYDSHGTLITNGTNTMYTIRDENWYTGVGGGFGGPTSQFVEKANWVRLRQITLSYSLGDNIVKKTGFKAISVYFTGKNLWLKTPYTGVDPETSLFGSHNAQGIDYFNMPSTKTFTFGIKLAI